MFMAAGWVRHGGCRGVNNKYLATMLHWWLGIERRSDTVNRSSTSDIGGRHWDVVIVYYKLQCRTRSAKALSTTITYCWQTDPLFWFAHYLLFILHSRLAAVSALIASAAGCLCIYRRQLVDRLIGRWEFKGAITPSERTGDRSKTATIRSHAFTPKVH